MRGIKVLEPIKELIIQRARDGDNINKLAQEFKLFPNTIRKWLAVSGGISGIVTNSNGSTRNLRSNDLLMAKLKRENAELLAIIGELTVLTRGLSKKKRQIKSYHPNQLKNKS
jgi:hypothetical protein